MPEPTAGRRPRRLDLLPPTTDTPPADRPPATDRALVVLGLWVLPLVNLILSATVLLVLLR